MLHVVGNAATCCAKKATVNWEQPGRSSIDYSSQLGQAFANKTASKMLSNVPLQARDRQQRAHLVPKCVLEQVTSNKVTPSCNQHEARTETFQYSVY